MRELNKLLDIVETEFDTLTDLINNDSSYDDSEIQLMERDRELLRWVLKQGLKIKDENKAGKAYAIRNEEGLYWSNENGWVDKDERDTFTKSERMKLRLPVGGYWVVFAEQIFHSYKE